MNREVLPNYFWLTLFILSFIWLLAFYFSPVHLWHSIVIFIPSVLVASVDAQTHFLPNKLLLMVWVSAAVEILATWVESGINLPILAILAGVCGGLLFWLFAVSGVGLGMGDVKLVPPILMVVVLSETLLPYIAALCVLPGLYAIIIFLRSGSLKKRISYGPWIVAALPISLFCGI